jgi:hypothetical protein
MRARVIVGLLFVGGASVGALQCSGQQAEPASAEHLTQRLWVDRMPRGERDMIRKLALVRSIDHGRFGVAERGSVWRHHTEVFKWGLHDGRLQMYLPQDRKHLTATVRTWECEGEAPDGFELCLEIRGGAGGTMRLYSRHDWKLHPRPSDDILDDGPLGGWQFPVLVEPTDAEAEGARPSEDSDVAALFAQ